MYIAQGKQGKLGLWKYIPIPLIFVAILGLQYLVMTLLNIDTAALMEKEILERGKNSVFVEGMLFMAAFLIALLFWVKYVHKQSILSLTTSRTEVDWGRIFFIFGLMSSFIIISTLLVYFLYPEIYEINFEPVPFLILAVIAVLLVPLQTSFEEYLFRGYLMQGLGIATKSKLFALLFTSILFGVMHIANPEVGKIGPIIMVYYIGTGLFLGIITLMDEGLELALGFHAANNLVSVLLVTADWTALQTDSIFIDVSEPDSGYQVLFPVLIIFPIFLFILSKKYKWTNWKDKLLGSVN
ncbi:CPBP family intramembrane glutamic endopeptidase [Aquimarina gracilis]|uniref:CPBP family intramembrane glutamic endopeptidase n=1 Tax=Aquimarina gracilis TaxID=874422 RepID=A0ABU6A1Q8_9FLAO|nr:CPBP family intramembrane glutamic endopeptidase [Aquimarina gracilis]MEB3348099.1 CPBP family intramembrane glutamic endopeptidase [Aquimarina gracilis]